MRLISCFIENFGRLSGLEIKFEEGLHEIYEGNGWGKSTLAAFLKAMFYGFEDKRGRKEKGERGRYEPWQKGLYGGRVEFMCEKGHFEIRRLFGRKESEDEFALTDLTTGLNSECFGKNTGEELFGINRESFGRTVFIGHEDCLTDTNDEINAGIGGFCSASGDLESFTRAMDRLEARRKEYGGSGRNAVIRVCNEKISELEKRIKYNCNAEKNLLAEKKEYEELKKERELLKSRGVELSAVKERVLGFSERFQILKQDREYRSELGLREADTDREAAFFGGRIPDGETLKRVRQAAEELNEALEKRRNLMPTEGEKRELEALGECFPQGVPKDEEYERVRDKINALRAGENKLQLMEMEKARLLEERETGGRRRKPLLIALGILFILGALIFFFVRTGGSFQPDLYPHSIMLSMLAGAVGLFVLLAGLIGSRRLEDGDARRMEDFSEKEREKIEEQNIQLTRSITAFFDNYGISTAGISPEEQLIKLRQFHQRYIELKAAAHNEEIETLTHRINELKWELEDFFCQYFDITGLKGFETALSRLEGHLNSYGNALREQERAYEKVSEYEKENYSILYETETEDLPDLPVVNGQIDDNSQRLASLEEKLHKLEGTIEELEEQTDDYDAACRNLELVKKELEEAKWEERITGLTAKLLSRARERLTAAYKNPMTEAFRKYYSLLTGEKGEDYLLDAGLKIHRDETGMQRDVESLSDGLKDTAGLCLRMALADAVFEKGEKPFILLDDPFINLDDEKTLRATAFIKKISEDYQVIYFTCNAQRSLKQM